MRNAKRFDERITIGVVPDSEDLKQLKDLGYKTLVDLRDEEEIFGGLVEKRALDLGLKYVKIPIYRDKITTEFVTQFYSCIYGKGSALIYCFSRFGKRPLAFLLLFDAVTQLKSLAWIYKEAAKFGLTFYGDIALQSFLINFYNTGCVEPIVKSIQKLRPDLFKKMNSVQRVYEYKEKVYRLDSEGFLFNFNDWDENFAIGMAFGSGMIQDLTPRHWQVIHFIRKTYQELGWCPLVFQTCKSQKLNIKEFEELFPTGYLRGACRLAGITYKEGFYEKGMRKVKIPEGAAAFDENKVYEVDVRGFLVNFTQWDEHFAIYKVHELKMAIGLTEEHWEIIYYLRQYYGENGMVPTIYRMCEDNQLSLLELEHLFADGYHRGAVKIAGLRVR
ncbi:TusE/DsrC/DsvC family sulfur relay protein [candidate division CSSED10-310 bacterium]|uniref:TusE/DsrC/DsvC family sulfur relay protein n=1 Tax=candidate division CSSED10-310 bacterium TaxID=2855610 RepID=A0ABV6YT03_UNCC1